MSLSWNELGQPCSIEFDDIYFSKASGLKESDYVFIQHNNLPQRFQHLIDNAHFTIGETGFGTGLNFLCAWQRFQQEAPADAYLHFISAEKFPLPPDELAKALQLWPELTPLSTQLLAQYPTKLASNQTLIFNQGRVILNLLIGDAQQQYQDINIKVDAWFLDGFSPAKNPEMWSDKLFKEVGRLSHSQTTFATFTSAGHVRRKLSAVGFKIQKTKGFAQKREMCFGHYQPPQ